MSLTTLRLRDISLPRPAGPLRWSAGAAGGIVAGWRWPSAAQFGGSGRRSAGGCGRWVAQSPTPCPSAPSTEWWCFFTGRLTESIRSGGGLAGGGCSSSGSSTSRILASSCDARSPSRKHTMWMCLQMTFWPTQSWQPHCIMCTHTLHSAHRCWQEAPGSGQLRCSCSTVCCSELGAAGSEVTSHAGSVDSDVRVTAAADSRTCLTAA